MQTATYAWGGLYIATGATIKPDKCYAYFLSHWYNHSPAKLRTVWAFSKSIAPITLPSGKIAPLHLRGPLPDRTTAPIPTLRNDYASVMLGIYFGPTSGRGKHVCEMAQKGYVWDNRLRSCLLPHALAWQSFTQQLQLGMMWGITTVVTSPQKPLGQFQQVYFRCLPLLNVNFLWHIIPEQYQGLGMANYVLVSFFVKLSFIQCNWGFEIAHLKAMMMGYESFMIEVGLYGNTRDYKYK
jgi:hypothetical protein